MDLLDGGNSIHDPAPARRLPGDGSSRWFHELHEYRYVEALLVIFFVAVTLIFELSWHKIRHAAEDSYHYGKFQHEAAKPRTGGVSRTTHIHHGSQHESAKLQHVRHGKHLQLYKELVNRMGGEFMTLGFLALGIFSFNQSGGFKVMAKYFPPCEDPYDPQCFHFPNGAYDWLHMMEVVHVKLFLGMLLYFVFMTFLVNYSVKQIESWERVKMRMDNVMMVVKNGKATEVEAELRYVDADLDEHILWRDNFVEHILGWQSRRPDLFAEVASLLCVDPQAADAPGLVRERVEGHFSLSSYLSLNLEVGVGDSIQVHLPTWLVLVVMFCFLALLHRFAYVQLRMVTPVIMLLFALQVLWVWRFSKDKRKKMKSFVDKRQRDETDDSEEAKRGSEREAGRARRCGCFRTNHAKSIENTVLRSMQVFMFLVSYSLSCAIGDVDMWQDTPLENLLLVLAYALVFLVMAKCTPAVLPDFLAIVSFPPYISDKTLALYFRVLFDKFELEGEEPGDLGQEVAVDEVMEENARRDSVRRSMRCSMSSGGPGGPGVSAMAAVEELAAILGAREELEQRLRRRSARSQGEAQAEPAEEAAEQPAARTSEHEPPPGEAFRTAV